MSSNTEELIVQSIIESIMEDVSIQALTEAGEPPAKRQAVTTDWAEQTDAWTSATTTQQPREESPTEEAKQDWDAEAREFDYKLSVKTNSLATKLHEYIVDSKWKQAVDTLKFILDLDPRQRHPPLYGWSNGYWNVNTNCPHCRTHNTGW